MKWSSTVEASLKQKRSTVAPTRTCPPSSVLCPPSSASVCDVWGIPLHLKWKSHVACGDFGFPVVFVFAAVVTACPEFTSLQTVRALWSNWPRDDGASAAHAAKTLTCLHCWGTFVRSLLTRCLTRCRQMSRLWTVCRCVSVWPASVVRLHLALLKQS